MEDFPNEGGNSKIENFEWKKAAEGQVS